MQGLSKAIGWSRYSSLRKPGPGSADLAEIKALGEGRAYAAMPVWPSARLWRVGQRRRPWSLNARTITALWPTTGGRKTRCHELGFRGPIQPPISPPKPGKSTLRNAPPRAFARPATSYQCACCCCKEILELRVAVWLVWDIGNGRRPASRLPWHLIIFL